MIRQSNLLTGVFFLGMILFVLSAQSAYDSLYDRNSDGGIDYRDLFEASTGWQQDPDVHEDFMLGLMRNWGSTGSAQPTATEVPATATPVATDTPDSGTERVLSFPDLLPVELPSSFISSVTVPISISLSNLQGVHRAEVWIKYLIPESNNKYSIITEAEPATRFAADGFTKISEQLKSNQGTLYWAVTVEANQPITPDGPGPLLHFSIIMYPLVIPPYPQVIVPLEFPPPSVMKIEGEGGTPLDFTARNGSLLFNPSGNPVSSPTPTGTPGPAGSPTPTLTRTATRTPTIFVTPTPPPVIAAKSLRITVCNPKQYVGKPLTFFVDQVDAEGRIVNPGIPGGDPARDITLRVSEPGYFLGRQSTVSAPLANPQGVINYNYVNCESAQILTLEAEAPNLETAEPVQLEFLPTGSISGTVRIWNGSEYVPASRGGGISISAYVSDATRYVDGGRVIENDGTYEVTGLPAGTYDLEFHHTLSTLPLQRVCVSGVEVEVLQDTAGVNADIGPLDNAAQISGEITTLDGTPLLSGTVSLNPVGDVRCGHYFQFASLNNPGGTIPLNYSMMNIPPDEYRITASASGSQFYSTLEPSVITLDNNENEQRNIILYPIYGIAPLSPLNYAKVGDQPVITWNLPQQARIHPLEFTVTVNDRCGTTVWVSPKTTDYQVKYTGPALSNQTIYTWYITGVDPDKELGAVLFTLPDQQSFRVE